MATCFESVTTTCHVLCYCEPVAASLHTRHCLMRRLDRAKAPGAAGTYHKGVAPGANCTAAATGGAEGGALIERRARVLVDRYEGVGRALEQQCGARAAAGSLVFATAHCVALGRRCTSARTVCGTSMCMCGGTSAVCSRHGGTGEQAHGHGVRVMGSWRNGRELMGTASVCCMHGACLGVA